MFSPTNTISMHHNALRSPLSPMRSPLPRKFKTNFTINTPNIVSDTEDNENSSPLPLQIQKTKRGLMTLTPFQVKKRRKKMATAATQTNVPATTSPAPETADTLQKELATYKTASMDVARQSRTARMQLHAAKLKNETLQEELATYKTASMDVARQSRTARMQLHAAKLKNETLQEELATYKTASMDVARQSRTARMHLHAAKLKNDTLQEQVEQSKDKTTTVLKKLKRRMNRMQKATDQAQHLNVELQAQNDELLQFIEAQKDTSDTAMQTMVFYLPLFLAFFSAVVACALTFH
jgi:chromosome segregation ATPase